MFDSHCNKAKLEKFNVRFAPQKGQARKLKCSICTTIRPSSKMSKVSLHGNKAKLGRFSSAISPCTSVGKILSYHLNEKIIKFFDQ